jgi:hypothetical protein
VHARGDRVQVCTLLQAQRLPERAVDRLVQQSGGRARALRGRTTSGAADWSRSARSENRDGNRLR